MTIEDCRTILKVHIQAAESTGRFKKALDLMEILDAIDAQMVQERAGNDPPQPQCPRKPPGRALSLLDG